MQDGLYRRHIGLKQVVDIACFLSALSVLLYGGKIVIRLPVFPLLASIGLWRVSENFRVPIEGKIFIGLSGRNIES